MARPLAHSAAPAGVHENGAVRVVAGSARGRRLKSPTGDAIRPTSDRVRESVFNMLESRGALSGAVVVDLFAGTGALGIEALSRGATSATFVDRDRRAVDLIAENLTATGFRDHTRVVRADAATYFAAGRAEAPTLVFADPPYAFSEWAELFDSIGDALVVAESDRELELPDTWEVFAVRRYGSTVVTLARRKGGM